MKLRFLLALLPGVFTGCSAARESIDDQIIGKWRSNRELSIATIRYPVGAQPETIKKLENIFGHIVMTYGPSDATAVMPAMNGFPEWHDRIEYKIVARSSTSITIRFYDNTEKKVRDRTLTFEGPNRYWIDLEKIEGREYFDRIQNDERA